MSSSDPTELAATGQLVGLREFPGYYVSSDGQLWSSWVRVSWMIDPETINPVKVQRDRGGYLAIGFKLAGKRVKRLIHRLVLEAFSGSCPDGMEACHYNGIRSDNRLENLRWGTRLENTDDRRRHGTHNRGGRNPNATLTETDAIQILALRRSGMKHRDIARKFGVATITIQKIVGGQLWPHIPR